MGKGILGATLPRLVERPHYCVAYRHHFGLLSVEASGEYAAHMFLSFGTWPRPTTAIWCSVGLHVVASACLPTDAELGRSRPHRDPTPATKPSAAAANRAAPTTNPTPLPPDPALDGVFKDDFERPTLGPNWRITSGRWRIEGGRACVSGARNHPLWLKRRIPTNAVIEFDATSASDDGDLKAEFWGDGRSGATSISYNNATSYLTIWGGWKNRYHVLARIDEHAKDRKQIQIDPAASALPQKPVERDRSYHFRIERRDGRTVQWFVDGQPILTYPDPEPLKGAGHEHFGFNNWEVPVCFDNLSLEALP